MPSSIALPLSLALAAVLGTRGTVAESSEIVYNQNKACILEPTIMGIDDTVSCNGTAAGEACAFQCRNANWRPTGPATCDEGGSGEWIEGPACKPDCITEPTFENMDSSHKCGQTEHGGLCHFRCIEGYTASRAANCMMWHGKAMWANGPVCNRVQTPAPTPAPPSLVLSTRASLSAGATSIAVADVTGIIGGQATVTISDRSNTEVRAISHITDSPYRIVFSEPLANTYSPGTVRVFAEAPTLPPTDLPTPAAPTTAAPTSTAAPTTAAPTSTAAPASAAADVQNDIRYQDAERDTPATAKKGKKDAKHPKKDGKGKGEKGKKGKKGKHGALAAKKSVTRQRAITAVGASTLLAMVGVIGAIAAFIRRDMKRSGSTGASAEHSDLLSEVEEPSVAEGTRGKGYTPMVDGDTRSKVSGYMLPKTEVKVGDLIMG